MNQLQRVRVISAIAFSAWMACACEQSANKETAAAPPAESTANTSELDSRLGVFAWSPAVLSGMEPRESEDFQSLESRKVKSIVCVDSSGEAIATATERKLRCFHVPIQYDGVTGDAKAALVAIAHEAPSPIYVYSFDNPTRGAVAAAIIARERNEISRGMVNELLNRAGARKRYESLWEAAQLHDSSGGTLIAIADVPSKATVSDFAEHMAAIGRAWPALGRWRAESMNSTIHPLPDDVTPMLESASKLAELFSELVAADLSDRDQQFLRALRKAHLETLILPELLQEHDGDGVHQAVTNLANSCRDCHNAFRNGRGTGEE